MSPAIFIFIIAVLAILSVTQTTASVVMALSLSIDNHKIPPAGASVTYTIQDQRTGKSYSVLYFVSTEMKQVEIKLPADFKEGDILNSTMVETFPYNLTQSTGFGPLGGAGAETGFDLSPAKIWTVQQSSRAI